MYLKNISTHQRFLSPLSQHSYLFQQRFQNIFPHYLQYIALLALGLGILQMYSCYQESHHKKQTNKQQHKTSNPLTLSPSPKSCLDQLVIRFHAHLLGLYVGILSSWSVCRSCVYCQNCYEFICSIILFNMESTVCLILSIIADSVHLLSLLLESSLNLRQI